MQRATHIFAVGIVVLLSASFTSLRALDAFPLEQVVNAAKTNLVSRSIKPTGLNRGDYLDVISGIVGYFRRFQQPEGRIIDPFLNKEFQYSTPCYAWAATTMVASGRQTNLLESAASALECALQELADDKAAMNHGDFFTFPCMLAYENLRDRVAPDRRKKWDDLLRRIQPELCYKDVLHEKRHEVHNWNVVALSGEFLRHQDGFTDLSFVEKYLGLQFTNFTATGQYRDPNVPMAYDHFPRHFLAAILERGYGGQHRKVLEELINRAAWTSLLMQSPNGELPTGGRSAQHQWNEAQQCVTFEIYAKRSNRSGDEVSSRAFKRAAHLSLQSVKHWIRPSGELWIVKNRFDPAVRHGFQNYSSHSQYNLLAASMLSSAWLFSDDSITEGPCPADVGGFAFELPQFHKVFANAGGMYVEIDTAADSEYNSTGFLRVHKAGIEPMVGPTDSAPMHEDPLACGIAWREGKDWRSLASLTANEIKSVEFQQLEGSSNKVRFSVCYEIDSDVAKSILENYEVTPEQISVHASVQGKTSKLQVRFPAFAFDGRDLSQIAIGPSSASVSLNGSKQVFSVDSRLAAPLHATGPWIASRNGFLQTIAGEVRGKSVVYRLTPQIAEQSVVRQTRH